MCGTYPGPLQVIREHDGHRIALSPTQDRGGVMSAADEAVVRRFYEEMNNDRKLELAPELFTADHKMHDPQVPAPDGPDGMAATVKVYQDGVEGRWEVEDIFSTDDKVAVRWIGSGTHVGEVNGIA